jgi:hypothetical protein
VERRLGIGRFEEGVELADSKKALKVSTNSTSGRSAASSSWREAPGTPAAKKWQLSHSGRLRRAEIPSIFSPRVASNGMRLRRFTSQAKRLAMRA